MFERALKDGLRFCCSACSQCCMGSPGYVWLSPDDADGLARHFSIDRKAFLLQYCIRVRVGEGFGYSLKEKIGNACVFLDNGRCGVYESRPIQCRTYPFWESSLDSESSWHAESAFCPGIDQGELWKPERIVASMLEARKNARLACKGNSDDWSDDV